MRPSELELSEDRTLLGWTHSWCSFSAREEESFAQRWWGLGGTCASQRHGGGLSRLLLGSPLVLPLQTIVAETC